MEVSLIRPSDKMAGYFGIDFDAGGDGTTELSIQFMIKRSSWVWGLKWLYWDGPIVKLGFGPLFLVGLRH